MKTYFIFEKYIRIYELQYYLKGFYTNLQTIDNIAKLSKSSQFIV